MAEAAAKEPTMEDILASIRKIISQDDQNRSPSQGARPSERASAPQAASSFAERMATVPHPGRPQPNGHGGAAAERPATLAALASQVKSQMPRPAEAPRASATAPRAPSNPEPRAPQHREEPRPGASAGFAPRSADAAPHAPERRGPTTPAPASARPEAAPRSAMPAHPAAAFSGEAGRSEPAGRVQPRQADRPATAANPQGDTEIHAFREALSSPSTQSAVAGSIERLKRAFTDDGAAKVEAVLRPMLREWMDENLPGIVERLVREEINRIARSG